MPVELRIAALGALLLFIHVFTATRFKTAQYGRKWNVGARDEELPPPQTIVGRLAREALGLPRQPRWSVLTTHTLSDRS
mgnify:CR=1 FL=1